MKRQIRQGIFETNSSSEHALAVVAYNDYERWKKGELVARSTGRKESPDPAGNFWSYLYDIEFAPAEQKDELNIKLIEENYNRIMDPDNGWETYTKPDNLLSMYKIGKMKYDMFFYITYEDFREAGFDGNYFLEHFSHDVPNGLKVFGTYYHS